MLSDEWAGCQQGNEMLKLQAGKASLTRKERGRDTAPEFRNQAAPVKSSSIDGAA